MSEEFIVAIREHSYFGWMPNTYLIERKSNREFYTIKETVLHSTTKKYPEKYSDSQKKITKLINEYSDETIKKLFSKKKDTAQEFLSTLDDDLVNKQIRPYIERRIVNIIKEINTSKIRLFYKLDKYSTIYDSDEIKVHEKPAETIFNFEKKEEGSRYYLSILHQGKEMNLSGRAGTILVNDPCHLILDNELFYFNDIDGKKLMPFFEKEFVTIPASVEKKYFKSFVLKAIKNYRVNAKGFTIKDIYPSQKAQLSLEKNTKQEPVLILKYYYGEKEFLPNNTTSIFVEFTSSKGEYTFTKLTRDFEWEKSCRNKLKQIGLKIENKTIISLPELNNSDNCQQKEHDFINWLNENKTQLTTQGFELLQPSKSTQYFTEKIKLKFNVKRKKDWFDVYAKVQFGEYEIPFLKLKNHILKHRREYILPNGEIAILPEEWFTKYREIIGLGKEIMGYIQLEAHHFKLLDNNDYEVTKADKHYLQSLEKLSLKKKVNHAIPSQLKAKLRTYQQEGFSWIYSLQENKFGGCLADDMGLGKTLQTLAVLAKTVEQQNDTSVTQAQTLQTRQLSIFDNPEKAETALTENAQANMIVMPKSLISNWMNEIKKFTPHLKVYLHIGNDREKDVDIFSQYHIILTSYGIIRNDIEFLKCYHFNYLILDESQYIKNPGSKIYQAITELPANYRLVLTGTPIENSLTDLWAQLNFLNPGLLGNLNFFKEEFVCPIERQKDNVQKQKLQNLIQPFLLRRTKNEVAKDLPALTQQILFCGMEEEQRSMYEKEKAKIRNLIIDNIHSSNKKESIAFVLLQGLMKLRQIANHPLMIEKKYTGESGKYQEITDKLQTLIAEGHKVLLFSSFVKHLKIFAEYLKNNDIRYSRITGDTRNREKEVTNFQQSEEVKVFLISLKAGGVGLNLTSADYVFILDPWWNPAVENQAINRAHRIGQDKKVFVYRFITEDSIEQKILHLQKQKTDLAEIFVNNNNPFKSLSTDAIIDLFE